MREHPAIHRPVCWCSVRRPHVGVRRRVKAYLFSGVHICPAAAHSPDQHLSARTRPRHSFVMNVTAVDIGRKLLVLLSFGRRHPRDTAFLWITR
jgi:hypothetical protein